jgi:N-carbamoylputrescine amidase
MSCQTGNHDNESNESGTKRTIKVAGIMSDMIRTGDYREHNFRKAEVQIRRAAKAGADLVSTCEQFLDGYGFDANKIENMDSGHVGRCEVFGKSIYIERLAALAKELDIIIVAGVALKEGKTTYNSTLIFDGEGRLVGKYRKTHNQNGYARWFALLTTAEKRSHCPSFDVGLGRISTKICNDRRFSETTHYMVENGAELILCPAYGRYNPSRLVEDAKEFGLWCVFLHPEGIQFINRDGVVLEKKKEEGVDDFALYEVEFVTPQ